MNNLKVLIVEDERVTVRVLTAQMKAEGFHICEPADSGEKAIEILKQESPDVVLMDINLSGNMNGIETVRKMKEIKDVTVIFITGLQNEDFSNEVNELNPAGYIFKPIDIDDIIKILENEFNA